MNDAGVAPTTWALIAGEYPPQPGGVSDYTWAVASALRTNGDKVHVITPGVATLADRSVDGVIVHRLSDRFGQRGISEMHAVLSSLPRPRRVIVQYVAQSFGWRGVNLLFACSLRRLRGYPLWIMFHEFAIKDDPRASVLRRIQALGTRLTAKYAARSADKVFVSTSTWTPLVAAAAPSCPIVELPIPSNVPTESDPIISSAIGEKYRGDGTTSLIGHFGTYRMADATAFLQSAIEQICLPDGTRRVLLTGRGSNDFCRQMVRAMPKLEGRIFGTGGLEPQDLANHLAACDVLIQPYADGVTTRRGSLLAGLALGVPTVTTGGQSTETFWASSNAIVIADSYDVAKTVSCIVQLLADPEHRRELSGNARELYRRHFDLSRTIATLRQA